MERQAWNREGGLDRIVLEHARAMLLVLAALVDRAAGLPTFERLRFLAVMGHGEAEARRLIVAMASDWSSAAPGEATPLSAADPCPDTPAMAAGETALLAARFRMLALAVEAILARSGPRPSQRHASPSASHEPRRPSQFTPSPALRATSPPQTGERAPRRRRHRS